jgi:hypothetical protein
VARLRLEQPAQVTVRVLRGKRVVRVLRETCAGAGVVPVTWNGRAADRKVRRGRYALEATIRSDRAPIVRRYRVRAR